MVRQSVAASRFDDAAAGAESGERGASGAQGFTAGVYVAADAAATGIAVEHQRHVFCQCSSCKETVLAL